jgi:hypothetical protein
VRAARRAKRIAEQGENSIRFSPGWNAGEEAELRRLFLEGKSDAEIGGYLDRSVYAVETRRGDLGLHHKCRYATWRGRPR